MYAAKFFLYVEAYKFTFRYLTFYIYIVFSREDGPSEGAEICSAPIV